MTVPTRTLATHESAHASAMILLGWTPLLTRIDNPKAGAAGSTRPDWETREIDRAAMKDLAVAVLAGPLSEGQTIDQTEWPPGLDDWDDGCAGDAEQLRFLADWIGRVDWIGAINRVQTMTRTREFRALRTAIAIELERVDLLLQPELVRIAHDVLGDEP